MYLGTRKRLYQRCVLHSAKDKVEVWILSPDLQVEEDLSHGRV